MEASCACYSLSSCLGKSGLKRHLIRSAANEQSVRTPASPTKRRLPSIRTTGGSTVISDTRSLSTLSADRNEYLRDSGAGTRILYGHPGHRLRAYCSLPNPANRTGRKGYGSSWTCHRIFLAAYGHPRSHRIIRMGFERRGVLARHLAVFLDFLQDGSFGWFKHLLM